MSKSPVVTLHVGQLKTATTSLQAALSGARAELASAGIRYEPGGGPCHNREALDLLRRDDEGFAVRGEVFRHKTRAVLADGRPYWDDFVASARAHDGRTLLSAEDLTFAGPVVSGIVGRDLAGVPVRIVVTSRPVSRLVVSAYGELAKKRPLPEPDEVMRLMLLSVLDHGHDSRFAWMLLDRVREVWGPIATDGWHVVTLLDQSADAYQRDYWRAMGIEGLTPPAVPAENRSLPAGALHALQEQFRSQDSFDPRVDGGTVAAMMAVDAARASAPRSRLVLDPGVAGLVDACFPADGQPAAAAAADLRARLIDPTPVIEYRSSGQPLDFEAEVAYWRQVMLRRRRLVRARIGLARRLGVRRRGSTDWDRFRDEVPGPGAGYFGESAS